MKQKIASNLAILMSLIVLLSACGYDAVFSDVKTTNQNIKLIEADYSDRDLDGTFQQAGATLILLNGDEAAVNGKGAEAGKNNVTISEEGVYIISGTWNDGQINVCADKTDKIQLVLMDAHITCKENSAIYIEQADKVFLTIAENTNNSIIDGVSYQMEDGEDEPNAAIFSKDDLTINGNGKLLVDAQYKNGIVSKDNLKITGGDITINAKNDGLRGKDCVAVCAGTIHITSGGDGIQSNNDTDTEKGWIAIDGGTFVIKAEKDGIQAESRLQITNGNIEIITAGGSENSNKKHEEMMHPSFERTTADAITKPTEKLQKEETLLNAESETVSAKALKAGNTIYISEGIFSIDSSDDSIHSNASVVIQGGEFSLQSGDDGIHADETLTVDKANIKVEKCYEGFEAVDLIINGGNISVIASDDGFNASRGKEESSENPQPQQKRMDQVEDVSILINGGSIFIDAGGDGIDSNGTLEITDGVVTVNGPINNGNGAVDYNGEAVISGGTFIASGSSGMAQNFSDGDQCSIMVNFLSPIKPGTLVALLDETDNTVLCYVSDKEFQNIVMSSPAIEKGKTYTLYIGGSNSGKIVNGYYTDGVYTKGTKIIAIEMDCFIKNLSEDGSSITKERSQGVPQGARPSPEDGMHVGPFN